MLKVIYCRDGRSISDFVALDFADDTIRQYLCDNKDVDVKVSNEIARDAFVLRLMEEKLSADDIEFYHENVKLEFDREIGLIAPDCVDVEEICLFAKMAENIVKLGYANMKARQLAEKDGKDAQQ